MDTQEFKAQFGRDLLLNTHSIYSLPYIDNKYIHKVSVMLLDNSNISFMTVMFIIDCDLSYFILDKPISIYDFESHICYIISSNINNYKQVKIKVMSYLFWSIDVTELTIYCHDYRQVQSLKELELENYTITSLFTLHLKYNIDEEVFKGCNIIFYVLQSFYFEYFEEECKSKPALNLYYLLITENDKSYLTDYICHKSYFCNQKISYSEYKTMSLEGSSYNRKLIIYDKSKLSLLLRFLMSVGKFKLKRVYMENKRTKII